MLREKKRKTGRGVKEGGSAEKKKGDGERDDRREGERRKEESGREM